MDNYFNFDSEERKANWCLKILLLGYFFSFILSTIIYFIIHNNKLILEEHDPDIDLSGIKFISFYLYDYMLEYEPGMSNLGETGKLILDCYTGYCSECVDNDCEAFKKVPHYECSRNCRLDKNYCNCCDVYEGGEFRGCNYKENDKYTNYKSCYPNNLIFSWKGKRYLRTKATNGLYSYLNSSIKANESCPEGTIMCGILDNLGNKLCYPSEIECPVNYITKDIKDDNISDYKELSINDNKYYYTNKKNETGKILGGLFADTDLLPKYGEEDCEILETDTISSFLKSNNYSLYIKSLDFNPNKDSNIDKKGKAYLKWCVPGVGREKILILLKT